MNPARRLILNIRLLLAFFTIAAMAFVFAGVAVAQQKSSPRRGTTTNGRVDHFYGRARFTARYFEARFSRASRSRGGRCRLHRHKPRWQNDAHPHQRLQPSGTTHSGHEDKAASTEWIFVFDISGRGSSDRNRLCKSRIHSAELRGIQTATNFMWRAE